MYVESAPHWTMANCIDHDQVYYIIWTNSTSFLLHDSYRHRALIKRAWAHLVRSAVPSLLLPPADPGFCLLVGFIFIVLRHHQNLSRYVGRFTGRFVRQAAAPKAEGNGKEREGAGIQRVRNPTKKLRCGGVLPGCAWMYAYSKRPILGERQIVRYGSNSILVSVLSLLVISAALTLRWSNSTHARTTRDETRRDNIFSAGCQEKRRAKAKQSKSKAN